MTDETVTLLVHTTYRVGSEDVDAYQALATRMAAAAIKRDGCVFLKVAQDVGDPTTFYLFEGWRDQDALDAHIASDDMKSVIKDAGRLRITERVVDTYAVSSRPASG